MTKLSSFNFRRDGDVNRGGLVPPPQREVWNWGQTSGVGGVKRASLYSLFRTAAGGE